MFYWHVHHDMLLELCHSYEERVAYIKANKPAKEVEPRLRLMQPVKGQLPSAVVKAGVASDQAWDAYDQALVAYDQALVAYDQARKASDQAWDAYDQALVAYDQEIEILHAQECPGCPWNGKTIFPGVRD